MFFITWRIHGVSFASCIQLIWHPILELHLIGFAVQIRNEYVMNYGLCVCRIVHGLNDQYNSYRKLFEWLETMTMNKLLKRDILCYPLHALHLGFRYMYCFAIIQLPIIRANFDNNEAIRTLCGIAKFPKVFLMLKQWEFHLISTRHSNICHNCLGTRDLKYVSLSENEWTIWKNKC